MKSKLEVARRTRVMHMNGMALRLIPAPVFDLMMLTRLDLGRNKLTSVPAEVGQLSFLEELWLNDNEYLADLPAELESCKRLTVLDLRHTSVRNLPREIGPRTR